MVWAIPPLSPQPPDLFDNNPTHIPSLFGMAFPDGILSHTKILAWHTMSHWYLSSLQPLYFDILCRDKLHRFEIIVKPDLFNSSLHVINTEPHDFNNVTFQKYSTCEDALVACWQRDGSRSSQFGAYIGVTSSRFTPVISDGSPAAKMLLPSTASGWPLFLCPTSGRYVYIDDDISGIVVVDLF